MSQINSKGSVVRRLIIRLLIGAAALITFAVVSFVYIAEHPSSEDRSSPALPVGSLVWAKLENASPMYKVCTAGDHRSIESQLDRGVCSAIVVEDGSYKLVNWSFPPDLDFKKTGSISLANSTEIMQVLESRFGAAYEINLDGSAQAGLSEDSKSVPENIKAALHGEVLAGRGYSLGSTSPINVAANGVSQYLTYDGFPDCNGGTMTCTWRIYTSKDQTRGGAILSGSSELFRMNHATNGFNDLLKVGNWGVDVYQFDGTHYVRKECYTASADARFMLSVTECLQFIEH